MKNDIYDRYRNYNESYCWQYSKRLENLDNDLKDAGLTHEKSKSLRISDFIFEYVSSENRSVCLDIKNFIERHEWLQKMPARPTHRFVTRWIGSKDKPIAGVCIMATPNSFSYILGKDNRDLEKLISRGACISWAPKNLGSWLIMQSIQWMVKNTQFRVFSAYSDPEAKELGTIYQACNFYYLGQSNGTMKQYFDHKRPELGWFSDREFRKRSKYKIYAQNAGVSKEEWNGYMGKWSPDWSKIPQDLKEKIKKEEKLYRESCEVREVLPKHKYVYILGKDNRETKKLRKLFDHCNPKLYNKKYRYPKIRGE